ncbi:MAG: RNA-binding protein [Bacteroidota bacterium]
MNIYVGNLAYAVTEQDLQEVFGEYGPVASVKVITDKFTGKSKGFAFVEMETEEAGAAAVEALNFQELSGRPMKVSKARPREPRRDNGGFRRDNRW